MKVARQADAHDLARAGRRSVGIIDQTLLPHRFATHAARNLAEAAHAIRAMEVRGAPLIGAAAAYGVALAMRARCRATRALDAACAALLATRPTAVNLRWAVEEMRRAARAAAAGARAPTRPSRARARSPTRTWRSTARIAGARAAADRGGAAEEGRRRGRDPHPLQRRLARDGRLGHGARADLSRARQRHSGACLGRRDAAAQPGRQPHRLGARPSTACRTRSSSTMPAAI